MKTGVNRGISGHESGGEEVQLANKNREENQEHGARDGGQAKGCGSAKIMRILVGLKETKHGMVR